MQPLERGVAYNPYIIVDEKTVLVDTVEFGESDIFLEKVERVLEGRTLDYLVINHMEPDHSGAVRDVIARYPDVNGELTKYLITNDEYDLYAYLTEEQYAPMKFHNGWCLVELLIAPSVKDLKAQLAKMK